MQTGKVPFSQINFGGYRVYQGLVGTVPGWPRFRLQKNRCTLPLMTRESWWIAAKIFLGLPVLFYALLSVLEPQKEIWRKPTKKVLIAFIIAWSAVLFFIALVFAWNALR
jgi:hypothetical protein